MARRILISGASIAGCTAAWWLVHYGFEVTVVERSDAFRDGGQNVDIRGAGREVLRRMGLENAALEHGTGEQGTAFIDEAGEVIAKFMADDMDVEGPTAEMEILRGDLARILFDATCEKANFRFGDTIRSTVPSSHTVSVEFESGRKEIFEAVIVAEGVGSSTRELVFPGENEPRWMDMTIAYFTIPRTEGDDRLWRWYHTTGGRAVSLRPDMHGTTRAMLSVQKTPGPELEWSTEKRKAWLHKEFKGAGWQSARVLDAMDNSSDFYFDVLRQVQLPRWHDRRVVLTGDAAWCVTPLGGVGATLAVVGSYVLAGELLSNGDAPAAFQAYEQRLRDFVEEAQDIPKIVPRMANPHSRLGLMLLNGAVRVASAPAIRDFFGKLVASKSNDIELPDYDVGMSGTRCSSSAR